MKARLWLVPMMVVACLAAAGRASAADPAKAPAVYPIQEQFVDAGGVMIYTLSVGRGAPLVILHGGPGASHDYFLPYLLPLARHNRLVFIDERGSGRSEKLEDASRYTVEAMVGGRRGGAQSRSVSARSTCSGTRSAACWRRRTRSSTRRTSRTSSCASTFHSTKALNEVFVRMKAAMPAELRDRIDTMEAAGLVRARQGLREEPLHQRLHDRRLGRGLLPVPLPEAARPQLRPGRQRQHGVGRLPRDVGLARRVRRRRQPRRRSSTRTGCRGSRCRR